MLQDAQGKEVVCLELGKEVELWNDRETALIAEVKRGVF